ncbi:integrase [Paenibacillus cellulosilyticus]|uniref:Integrase n=1 Tax=Paenibacillus cellulosilyticus TaxID=375489 RepID=A0A2V2YGP7_9BACL|nr:site-specific integrase [Paenibacillus cellulosilyticus]PWV92006.1 integrase [Paenibacillus cellulosilyticus]
MARWEKRGKTSYRLIVESKKPDGSRDRITETAHCRNGKEADKELAKLVVAVEEGTYVPKKLRKQQQQQTAETEHALPDLPKRYTLRELVELWERNYASNPNIMSENTCYNRMVYLNGYILPYLGDKYIDEITTIMLVEHFNFLRTEKLTKKGKPMSLNSMSYLHTALKNVFTRSIEWKLLKENPMVGVKNVRESKYINKEMYYESNESEEIIKRLFSLPLMWALFFCLAIIGGFRRGEIVALEWTGVDFEKNELSIVKTISRKLPLIGFVERNPKTKTSKRTVIMPVWFMHLLRLYQVQWEEAKEAIGYAWEGGSRQYLFHAGKGLPISVTAPRKRWIKFLDYHRFRFVTIHGLRHTMATMMLDEGFSLKVIQDRIGHANLASTEIYAHVTKSAQKSVADHFEKLAPEKFGTNLAPIN